MQRFLERHQGTLYAILRGAAGFLFACHGAQKVLGLFGGASGVPPALLWSAGLIELVGGTLIALGLFTRWAAFVCSGQMAVAYFTAHQGRALFPIQNGGELAALYAWLFLFIAARGSGSLSLDARRGERAEGSA